MTTPLLWGAFDYWSQYHKVTFDGINKRIYINPDVTNIDVETDLYSDWKEWAILYDNLKYEPAFRTTGGDPLPGGRRVGQYFFLINGWRLVPPVDFLIDDIEIVGNLFTEDESNVFDLTKVEGYRLIRQVVSQFTEIASPTVDAGDISIIITGSGLTPDESQKIDSLVTLNSLQTQSLDILLASSSQSSQVLQQIQSTQLQVSSSITGIEATVLSTDNTVTDISVSQSLQYVQLLELSSSLVLQLQVLEQQSASLVVQSASLAQQTQLILQQSASIGQIQTNTEDLLNAGGSLTPEQATMLMEVYRLLGLDPTRPLIVSPTTRDAGAEIAQTIQKVGDVVTVTRT